MSNGAMTVPALRLPPVAPSTPPAGYRDIVNVAGSIYLVSDDGSLTPLGGGGARDLTTRGLLASTVSAYWPDAGEWIQDMTGYGFVDATTIAGGATGPAADPSANGSGRYLFTLPASGAIYTILPQVGVACTRSVANSPWAIHWAGRINALGTNCDIGLCGIIQQSGLVIATTDAGMSQYTCLGLWPATSSAFLTLKTWNAGAAAAVSLVTTIPVDVGVDHKYSVIHDGMGTVDVLKDGVIAFTTTDMRSMSGLPGVFFSFGRATGAPSVTTAVSNDLFGCHQSRV